jgi:hypothetical protein
MLSEIRGARQIAGEGFRRWFTDNDLDLILWYGDDGQPLGFQLCYDKEDVERALTWTAAYGFQHNRIDAGEVPGRAKMTPLIIADGSFSPDTVAARFLRDSADLEPAIVTFVHEKLKSYPA